MGTILSLALVRGLLGQLVGTFVGMWVTMAIRRMIGMDAWNAEPVILISSIIGVFGFLIGSGTVSDWMKWCVGIDSPIQHGAPEGKPAWTRYFNIDYDHKIIGIQYGVAGMVLLLVGGTLAIIFRLELAQPGVQFLNAEAYNTVFSAHGIIMIASILLGVGAMINYLVPLMIGASDMAFPRLNAFGFWINIPAGVLLVVAMFIGGFDTGWTAYPPNSTTSTELGISLFLLGFYTIGFSSIAGGINLLITVGTMRAPGMSLFKMPIFVWAAIATSIIQMTATQTVGLALMMLMTQRTLGMGFFDPASGGDPLLFQHLFWFYSHPAVYVFILPGLGIISELLPVFSRKPLFGYKWIALSSIAIALVGFIVWAHHMFMAGMSDNLRLLFMYSTLMVAIPTGVKFFSWVGTLWEGKLSFETPMLFTLGAISIFLIGGLSGPPAGLLTTDMHLHDTYFIVGHFHATMFGGFVFPFFAAIYYWFPKMTGRMYNETLGKIHFWLMTPGFWAMSIGQMSIGMLGMRRRIADYDPALGDGAVATGQLVITIAALIIGWSVLIMIVNLIWSSNSGERVGANPWNSRSPEWQIPSPVPAHNYDQPFEVIGNPYDYGLPNAPYVSISSDSLAGD